MKLSNKIWMVLTISLLFYALFFPKATSITNIGNSYVNIDEGDVYVWNMTSNSWSPGQVGDLYNITIDEIYQGSHEGITCLIVNATIGRYDNSAGSWSTQFSGVFMAYNRDLNYINLTKTAKLRYCIIPIPRNFPLIENFMNDTYTDPGEGCDVNGDILTIIEGSGPPSQTLTMTFHSAGFATEINYDYQTLETYTLELITSFNTDLPDFSGTGNGIPFGNFYLLITITAIISLIFSVKKRKTCK